jgi:hypothetical protein
VRDKSRSAKRPKQKSERKGGKCRGWKAVESSGMGAGKDEYEIGFCFKWGASSYKERRGKSGKDVKRHAAG